MDHGTMNLVHLDAPTQKGVRELEGRKLVEVFNPEDKETIFAGIFKEIMEFKRVTPVSYVRPFVHIPKFSDVSYNLSYFFNTTDVLEEDYKKDKIVHSPEKLAYLLGSLLNCSLAVEEIIYLPYVKVDFTVSGQRMGEERYIACLKAKGHPFKYESPVKVKTVMIGTKGHGLESVPIEDVAINFSNIAGMDDVKKKLRESIISPLLNPKLAKQYGSKVGGGVLLYGPPGCGKTYIMRATVGEAGVNFYTVGIQEIIGDDPESGAKKLSQAFNEARAGAPSILFFDEIEALGGKRGEGQSSATRLVVNQLLTELAGVESSNDNVLIVGSTNSPWDMDAALRRSGRFTNQVFIPPPDFNARKVMFQIQTKYRPLSDDVDFTKLAEMTEDHSSADLAAICDEAAKIPWNESLQGAPKRKIMMSDFTKVLSERESTITPWLRVAERQIRESGESDIYPELAEFLFKRAGGLDMVSKPDLKFSGVGDLAEVKQEIKMMVIEPLLNPELAKKFGREVGGGILFYGPPGCGKTYIARATAGECDASFFNVRLTDVLSSEVGSGERKIRDIFERALKNKPAIIFFDEIDAIAGKRDEAGKSRTIINALLTEMDGFVGREGVVIIGATNIPWDIDPALRRPGRFTEQLYLGPPDQDSRKQLFGFYTQNKPLDPKVDFSVLSGMTDGFSSADIKAICDAAAEIPWVSALEGKGERPVNHEDFTKAVSNVKSSLKPWFLLAEQQINASGEKDIYSGLLEDIQKQKAKKRVYTSDDD